MQVFFILFSIHFAVYQYINSKCLYRTHVNYAVCTLNQHVYLRPLRTLLAAPRVILCAYLLDTQGFLYLRHMRHTHALKSQPVPRIDSGRLLVVTPILLVVDGASEECIVKDTEEIHPLIQPMPPKC